MASTASPPTQGPTVPLRGSFFDPEALAELAERVAPGYDQAQPFPHVVIDDFLPPENLELVVEELSAGVEHTERYDNAEERKLATDDESRLPPTARHLLTQFNSAPFLEFLERVTGIEGLIPDPHFVGGGFHEIKRGGFLKVHADFNRHRRLGLDRRLNVLLYLNRDWQEEYGGHLELWSRDMKTCEQRILPIFNRCVIFSTTDFAYHGHPEPLTCPEDRSRRSLALYYYTAGGSSDADVMERGTLFRARPGESKKARARMFVKRLIPPIVLDVVRDVRMRRHRA